MTPSQLFQKLQEATSLDPTILLIISAILLIVVLQILFSSFKLVRQSENWTVERFGRYRKTLKPGFNMVVPLLDSIGTRINMREQVLDVPPQYIITSDNATVTVDGVVFFQVFNAFKAAYEIQDLEVAITQLAITNIRTVMGEMELDKLLSNREVINAKLLKVIDEATDPWGVKVIRIEIKDITPPDDIQDAMAEQMKAERKRRVEITTAEADRKAAILRAEGDSKAVIINAEADKTSRILAAEASMKEAELQAKARETLAKAESKAIDQVSKSIKNGTVQAPNYFLGKNYIDSLKQVGSAPNSKVLFMPFEASNFMSTVGSLTDLAKTMMKEDQPKGASSKKTKA